MVEWPWSELVRNLKYSDGTMERLGCWHVTFGTIFKLLMGDILSFCVSLLLSSYFFFLVLFLEMCFGRNVPPVRLPLHQMTDCTFLNYFIVNARVSAGGGSTLHSGLYGEAPPERGSLFKVRSVLKGREIAISVYERATKSAAKWKKWWLKRNISKGTTFWQKWLHNWIRTTENAGKTWRLQEILLFWLILEVWERGAILL